MNDRFDAEWLWWLELNCGRDFSREVDVEFFNFFFKKRGVTNLGVSSNMEDKRLFIQAQSLVLYLDTDQIRLTCWSVATLDKRLQSRKQIRKITLFTLVFKLNSLIPVSSNSPIIMPKSRNKKWLNFKFGDFIPWTESFFKCRKTDNDCSNVF